MAEPKQRGKCSLSRRFGLSDRQIDLIAEAAPKRDYYYVSPLGRPRFQFGLGPVALAFIGAGSKEDVLAARHLGAEHEHHWPLERLRLRGPGERAVYLDRHLHPGYNAANTPGIQSPMASSDTTLNTLNGALQSAQMLAGTFQAEQVTRQSLEMKNQTAVGRLQAIQVGNEIALAQVQQVQLLRQLDDDTQGDRPDSWMT